MTLLVILVPYHYFFGYFIFFSALIVTIRTDLEYMLISRFVSLFLAPVGIVLSAADMLPLTAWESFMGACIGYGLLLLIAKLFYAVAQKEGLGLGDVDLMACIGAFTGSYGCWMSLLLGSLMGSVIGIGYMVMTRKDRSLKIPFGPFLAMGAIVFVLFRESIIQFLQETS
jgi:leader peptidase (prepilin peptidase)/N-methyltransferase